MQEYSKYFWCYNFLRIAQEIIASKIFAILYIVANQVNLQLLVYLGWSNPKSHYSDWSWVIWRQIWGHIAKMFTIVAKIFTIVAILVKLTFCQKSKKKFLLQFFFQQFWSNLPFSKNRKKKFLLYFFSATKFFFEIWKIDQKYMVWIKVMHPRYASIKRYKRI